jgi:uncharacterized protein YrrD
MIRFTTDIVGAQILLFQEQATLGPVKRIVFSSESLDVLGLLAYDPILKKEVVLLPRNIKKMIQDIIVADGYDTLGDPQDVIRIHEAMREDIQVIKEVVVTESGQKLGRVTTATIDTLSWKISRLYVNPPLGLKGLTKELLIPAKKIVKIEKKQIIVSDDFATVKGIKTVPVPKPILD